jgi:hypothetical protein
MRKTLLALTATVLIGTTAFAQGSDDNIRNAAKNPEAIKVGGNDSIPWHYGGFAGASFNQAAYSYWSAGGQNSVGFLVKGNLFAHYTKKKILWDTDLNLALGAIWQYQKAAAQEPFRKTEDNLQLTTKVGYILNKKKTLSAAFLGDWKTSMINGYDYSAIDGGKVANAKKQLRTTAFSPSYVTLSIGINYKPVPYFSIYFSPIAGKLTFFNQHVEDSAYNTNDGTKFGMAAANTSVRAEFGALLRADFQKDLYKNFNFKTSLEIFQNYHEKKIDEIDGLTPYNNNGHPDVAWNTWFTLKVNEYFSASLETGLLWDYNTIFANPDPALAADPKKSVRRVQLRESFGINVGYKFAGHTKVK